jgi:hypothetical protein
VVVPYRAEIGNRVAELYTIERSIMNLLPVVTNPTSTAALGSVGRVGCQRLGHASGEEPAHGRIFHWRRPICFVGTSLRPAFRLTCLRKERSPPWTIPESETPQICRLNELPGLADNPVSYSILRTARVTPIPMAGRPPL